jgi:hypothetical protein
MKYFVLFLLFCLSCQSQGTHKRVCVNEIKNSLVELRTSEYFVSEGTDTMSLSFVFTEDKRKEIVNLDILNLEETKLYMTQYEDDISILDSLGVVKEGYYKHSDYAGFLLELKDCVEKAAEDFELSKLHHIRFSLTDIPEIAIDVSKRVDFNDVSHQSINCALKKTEIEYDINAILKEYNLKIVQISSDDMIFTQNVLSYCGRFNIKEIDMPKFIVDTNVIITVKEIIGTGF